MLELCAIATCWGCDCERTFRVTLDIDIEAEDNFGNTTNRIVTKFSPTHPDDWIAETDWRGEVRKMWCSTDCRTAYLDRACKTCG